MLFLLPRTFSSPLSWLPLGLRLNSTLKSLPWPPHVMSGVSAICSIGTHTAQCLNLLKFLFLYWAVSSLKEEVMPVLIPTIIRSYLAQYRYTADAYQIVFGWTWNELTSPAMQKGNQRMTSKLNLPLLGRRVCLFRSDLYKSASSHRNEKLEIKQEKCHILTE